MKCLFIEWALCLCGGGIVKIPFMHAYTVHSIQFARAMCELLSKVMRPLPRSLAEKNKIFFECVARIVWHYPFSLWIKLFNFKWLISVHIDKSIKHTTKAPISGLLPHRYTRTKWKNRGHAFKNKLYYFPFEFGEFPFLYLAVVLLALTSDK